MLPHSITQLTPAAYLHCSYEAWVIYNFMSLCLAYVGGPGVVEVKMNGFVLQPSWPACTCCLPPMPVNGHFIRSVKRGALQFVLVKPILAALTLVTYATGHYTEGDWSPTGAYLWITLLYNITYTIALYALLLFYMGTHDLLVPFRPLLKFVLVKSVIFLTFWQGLLISICVGSGIIATSADGNNLQNWLICVEMLPAAICMLFAFPWQDYAGAGGALSGTNVTHAMSIRDLVADTVHQFAPQYHNYVLYSDGTSKTMTTPEGRGIGSDGGSPHVMGAITEADNADLLRNVELGGVHAWGSSSGRLNQSSDSAWGTTTSPRNGSGTKFQLRDSDEFAS